MYDLVSIGDVKLDVFISLDQCLHKCNLKEKKVSFDFGEKISVEVLDQQTAGSAPNVATALSRMNFKTAVISNMGQDQTYLQAQRDLSNEGVDTRFITPHKGEKSAFSAVLTLQGEKTILVSYILKQYKLPKRLSTKWLFVSEMGNGYDKLFKQVIKFMKKGETKLAFNPGNKQIADLKPELYDLIAVTDILFVNVGEGREILKSKKIGIPQMAKRLFKMGPSEVILTDGRNGAYGYDGKTLWKLPMFPAKRVEATGAGDSFAAAYLGARLHGKGVEDGLMWGTVNSANVVEHVGPVPGLLTHTQILSRLKKAKSFRPNAL